MKTEVVDQLIKIVGRDGVLTTPEDLAAYSFDGTFAEGTPGAVVLPRSTDQVSQVVRAAAEAHVPIIPRGMGTGLAAGIAGDVPADGGMAIAGRIRRVEQAALFDGRLQVGGDHAGLDVGGSIAFIDLQYAGHACQAED